MNTWSKKGTMCILREITSRVFGNRNEKKFKLDIWPLNNVIKPRDKQHLTCIWQHQRLASITSTSVGALHHVKKWVSFTNIRTLYFHPIRRLLSLYYWQTHFFPTHSLPYQEDLMQLCVGWFFKKLCFQHKAFQFSSKLLKCDTLVWLRVSQRSLHKGVQQKESFYTCVP